SVPWSALPVVVRADADFALRYAQRQRLVLGVLGDVALEVIVPDVPAVPASQHFLILGEVDQVLRLDGFIDCDNSLCHCSFLSLWLVVSMLHTVVSVVKRASLGLDRRCLPVWLPLLRAVVLSRPRRRNRGRCSLRTHPPPARARS